jgi:hypothetical protein
MRSVASLIVLLLIAGAACTASADTFDRGIVIAKVIGPCDARPDFAEPQVKGTAPCFLTTIEIVDVKNGFEESLKGTRITLRTSPFEKKLIGKAIPLQLISINRQGETRRNLMFECSALSGSYLCAKGIGKQPL